VAQPIRIKRRWICELHSRRVRRVVVDRALLYADKDHDERRIRTLCKSEKKRLQYLGHSTSILPHDSPRRIITPSP
jgi:hypothetical protein